jgi:negative regulator of genetic competence, sporulation and motility
VASWRQQGQTENLARTEENLVAKLKSQSILLEDQAESQKKMAEQTRECELKIEKIASSFTKFEDAVCLALNIKREKKAGQ